MAVKTFQLLMYWTPIKLTQVIHNPSCLTGNIEVAFLEHLPTHQTLSPSYPGSRTSTATPTEAAVGRCLSFNAGCGVGSGEKLETNIIKKNISFK